MTKKELAQKLARTHNLTIQAASRYVTDLFDMITDELADQRDVTIVGFGKFKVRHRHARIGRNPNTGETLKLPATQTPIFQAGKDLTQKVKDRYSQ